MSLRFPGTRSHHSPRSEAWPAQIWRIKQANVQTVALQLPEGLQLFACTLADIIGAYAGVEVLPPRRKFPMQSWPNYPMPLSAAGARRGLPPWVCVGGARDPRAHDGRAGADARTQAQARARADGRHVAFIGYVCGTDRDPQDRTSIVAALRDAGVFVASSNAEAAMWSAALISERKAVV